MTAPRTLAKHLYQALTTISDFRAADQEDEAGSITVMLYAHLRTNDYLKSFTEYGYWSVSSLTEELREFVERQLVEGVNRENGGLVLKLALNAIRDAKWEELAASNRRRAVREEYRVVR